MVSIELYRKAIKIFFVFIAFVIYHFGITLVIERFNVDYFDVLISYAIYYSVSLVSFYWALDGNKKNKLSAHNFWKSIAVYIAANLVFYLFYYKFLPWTDRRYYAISVGSFRFFMESLETFIVYFAYAFFYWHYKRSIRTEHLLRISQKARLEAEFNHLRTQINPHFLFNTLNTFYSQSLRSLPDTAKGISLLSKIMRYSLEPPGTDGKVPLEDEIAHANDYIELMKIRFPGMLSITSNLPEETPQGWQILPHIVITLVENAFKHGNREQPFVFDLELANNQITFRVENTIGEKPAESGAGVGLPNLKERLSYAYGKKCTFEEGPQGNKYKTLLVIPNAYIIPQITAKEEPRPGINYQLSNLS